MSIQARGSIREVDSGQFYASFRVEAHDADGVTVETFEPPHHFLTREEGKHWIEREVAAKGIRKIEID
jgi:hypothetical protein